jgi:hypothetical protein
MTDIFDTKLQSYLYCPVPGSNFPLTDLQDGLAQLLESNYGKGSDDGLDLPVCDSNPSHFPDIIRTVTVQYVQ